jgi:outer membrane protein assembly factor BamB
VRFASWRKDGKRVYVGTDAHVIASLRAATGVTAWRQTLPESEHLDGLLHDAKALFSVSDGGRVVRSFETGSGALRWLARTDRAPATSALAAAAHAQKHFGAPSSPRANAVASLLVPGSKHGVVVLQHHTVRMFARNSGDVKWTRELTTSSTASAPLDFELTLVNDDKHVLVVGNAQAPRSPAVHRWLLDVTTGDAVVDEQVLPNVTRAGPLSNWTLLPSGWLFATHARKIFVVNAAVTGAPTAKELNHGKDLLAGLEDVSIGQMESFVLAGGHPVVTSLGLPHTFAVKYDQLILFIKFKFADDGSYAFKIVHVSQAFGVEGDNSMRIESMPAAARTQNGIVVMQSAFTLVVRVIL